MPHVICEKVNKRKHLCVFEKVVIAVFCGGSISAASKNYE
jgi:hypothetical protein